MVSWVAGDMGFPAAKIRLPASFRSRLRVTHGTDIHTDGQTDTGHHCIMTTPYGDVGIKIQHFMRRCNMSIKSLQGRRVYTNSRSVTVSAASPVRSLPGRRSLRNIPVINTSVNDCRASLSGLKHALIQ